MSFSSSSSSSSYGAACGLRLQRLLTSLGSRAAPHARRPALQQPRSWALDAARNALLRAKARSGIGGSSLGRVGGGVSGAGAAASSVGPLAYLTKKKAEVSLLFKKYGWVTVATYFSVYLVTLSGVYGVVSLGLLPVLDVDAFINSLQVKRWAVGDAPISIPPWASPLATAWIITKTTEPVRLVFTAAIMPTVVKRLPPHVLALFGVRA